MLCKRHPTTHQSINRRPIKNDNDITIALTLWLVIRFWFHTSVHKGLFTPWTMKSSQGHVKYVIRCWARPGTTSVYTEPKKKVRVTMEFEVPKRHILRPTLSTDTVQRVSQWERQKRCSSRKRQGPMTKKYCYSKFLMNSFYGEEKMKTRDDKRMVKLDSFFFSKLPILGIY